MHLHVLKVDWSSSVRISGAYLLPTDEQLGIGTMASATEGNPVFDLQGRPVDHRHLQRGLYIINGKKVFIK